MTPAFQTACGNSDSSGCEPPRAVGIEDPLPKEGASLRGKPDTSHSAWGTWPPLGWSKLVPHRSTEPKRIIWTPAVGWARGADGDESPGPSPHRLMLSLTGTQRPFPRSGCCQRLCSPGRGGLGEVTGVWKTERQEGWRQGQVLEGRSCFQGVSALSEGQSPRVSTLAVIPDSRTM